MNDKTDMLENDNCHSSKKANINLFLKNGVIQATICVLILVGLLVVPLPPAAWKTYLAGIGFVFGAYSLKNFEMYFKEENKTTEKAEDMKEIDNTEKF